MKDLKVMSFSKLEDLLVGLKNQNKSIINSLEIEEVKREIKKRKL